MITSINPISISDSGAPSLQAAGPGFAALLDQVPAATMAPIGQPAAPTTLRLVRPAVPPPPVAPCDFVPAPIDTHRRGAPSEPHDIASPLSSDEDDAEPPVLLILQAAIAPQLPPAGPAITPWSATGPATRPAIHPARTIKPPPPAAEAETTDLPAAARKIDAPQRASAMPSIEPTTAPAPSEPKTSTAVPQLVVEGQPGPADLRRAAIDTATPNIAERGQPQADGPSRQDEASAPRRRLASGEIPSFTAERRRPDGSASLLPTYPLPKTDSALGRDRPPESSGRAPGVDTPLSFASSEGSASATILPSLSLSVPPSPSDPSSPAAAAARPETAAAAPPPGFALETAALGPVAADLSPVPRDGAAEWLHVHFAVERPDTAAMIVDAGPGLDLALAAAGARLDAVSVEVRSEARGQGAPGDPAPHRSDPRDPPPGESRRDRLYRPDPPARPSVPPATRDRFA